MFMTIEHEDKGSRWRIARILSFATLILIFWMAVESGPNANGPTGLDTGFVEVMSICGLPLIVFWIYAWFWESNSPKIDPNNRICTNCDTLVETSLVMQTHFCKVLGVTDSTRAITSSNPVVGVTSSGGNMGVGLGSMQSTSHVPVKIGKVEITVTCPLCKAVFSWIENREVIQWVDSEGQLSYEIPGSISLLPIQPQ